VSGLELDDLDEEEEDDDGLRDRLRLRDLSVLSVSDSFRPRVSLCSSDFLGLSSAGGSTPQLAITTGRMGLSRSSVICLSIVRTTSAPSTTSPNTVCFPFRWSCLLQVMKNCDPFVLGPALAIDNNIARLCLTIKFSSSDCKIAWLRILNTII